MSAAELVGLIVSRRSCSSTCSYALLRAGAVLR